MKAQVRNPLANLLGTEPRWPDPEESIGDFITLIDGKKSCWKAKGRAREAFEILAKDIKPYTDKCVDSIPGSDWVTWSIYMIGKTPQRAAPVVMFFCEEPRPRRKVQEVIKKSGILERYPGIKSGNAALPPDLDQLEQLASDAVSHEDTAKTGGSNLNFTITVSRNRVFVTGHHGNTSSTRIATVGGIVQHNGDAYLFTAGHPLDQTSPSRPPREPRVIDEEWEMDSDGDTEVDIYEAEFVEAMSQASNTPVDARSETSSWSDDGSSETHSTRSLQFSDASNSVEDRFSDGPSQTQAATRRVVKTWASEDTIRARDVHKFGQNASAVPASAAKEGHLVLLSADLDYALIKFKHPSLRAVNDSAGDESAANLLQPTHVITTGPRDTEIITYTASDGLMNGTLYGTPSYTRLPNSKTFQKVYTVRFNGPLTKGDCGSWVIDAETHGLYGHIIAGCERTRTAYVMSAHNVFEDAKERLGKELVLGGRRSASEHSHADGIVPGQALSASGDESWETPLSDYPHESVGEPLGRSISESSHASSSMSWEMSAPESLTSSDQMWETAASESSASNGKNWETSVSGPRYNSDELTPRPDYSSPAAEQALPGSITSPQSGLPTTSQSSPVNSADMMSQKASPTRALYGGSHGSSSTPQQQHSFPYGGPSPVQQSPHSASAPTSRISPPIGHSPIGANQNPFARPPYPSYSLPAMPGPIMAATEKQRLLNGPDKEQTGSQCYSLIPGVDWEKIRQSGGQTYFLPAGGIEPEVIGADIGIYVGRNAEVQFDQVRKRI
jgi:hypothetical protein